MNRVFAVCKAVLAMLFVGHFSVAQAMEYPLPPSNSRLIGENRVLIVPNDGRSLERIASDYQIGLIAMLEANPDVDPLLPKAGSELILPLQMILPDTPRDGIVINLSELRLYYYPKGKNTVIVYPIGIGQLGRDTPVMTTTIIERKANPTWTPTANIRKNYAAEGIILPAVIPAGPENPMGLFALRLAAAGGTYLIHGTNADFGIGMRVSSGCIRLRPNDIEELFNTVPVGTRVQVVNEPIKATVEPDGSRYVEIHQPLSKSENDDPQTKPIEIHPSIATFINNPSTDSSRVNAEIERRSGLPLLVNR
ncbi:L,D-transpeptidase family protein [Budviciaceae bacterium BWR-B9]|uniref:L,D-transpeptidase n=2 Tax=Limnobaculum TaxID=2172100 RepID=A0A411WJK5_9GAMM|nr:L,D-transpeptidase family protein [Limnobaculum allomyrinae]MBV7690752.1 L,D-transpeptidase family protein [Limnobaculum sp. M2-1]QBH96389.1 L,D-transpeptidase [Limnobaculum zhutongyuii]TQS86685.1 L,D-transpeptidase [Limnobaculum zhutongyuii]